ncbi:MAG: hypothetical protein JWN18_545 [Parcubacteria group bacterium]|nr:hypothetical protein [Parcubacteria group bacterium]
MRTFNDIVPPSRRKEVVPLSTDSNFNRPSLPPQQGVVRGPERPTRFPYATLAAVILVIILSAGILFYFSSAKVEITPTTVSAAVQSSFTANTSGSALPFQVITAQKVASQSVKGSGTKTVNTVASGTITIYNTQAKPQPLVVKTRFATPAGLIFHLSSGVTVPAGTLASPGKITAKVYADQAGGSYNVAPTNFTVPGFTGSPQEKAVYAKSTSAMTGGASGTVPVVDAATATKTNDTLIKALTPGLLESIQSQVPAGFVIIPGSATTTFQELAATPSSTSDMVDMKQQGTVTAIVFPNSALAKAIATSVSGLNYQGEPVTLASSSNLALTSAMVPDSSASTYSFTLSGTAALIYTVDTSRIAAAVSGKSRSAAEVALTNYPEVKRAIIILRPFWRSSFPQDPASISVVVNNP